MPTPSINDILTASRDNSIIKRELSKFFSVKEEEIVGILDGYIISDKTVIYIDGGSRGNPGDAGAGVILDNNGKRSGFYRYLGVKTNNEAEYSALIIGITVALENNVKNIKVFSDSELLCNQINGVYKVKNENLKKYYIEAKSLIDKLNSFEIKHILREQNGLADKMANKAMDLKDNGEIELTVAAGL
ncbi:MAG: 14.7 kDa ribonuclease H-like protein [Spirochaetes bacterium ADurb.Bin133]|nr:MAG: 14.7 kDa ribonuclease H-like protein [Spirochaetes bacterium ADurb.Bin133]